MDAKPTLENMKLLGILDMIEKMLLADAYYHPLDTNDIRRMFHNIRYENGFELTKEDE